MTNTTQLTLTEVSDSYWRVTIDNGPINLMGIQMVEELAEIIGKIETAPDLKVVVFDSANPEFFIAHWDVMEDGAKILAMPAGPTGMHPYNDNFARLSRVPAVTISLIRGRVRGAGSEFALATDIRFAGDRAILGQFEVGAGAVPGGGAMARLSRLVGRGRAIEILLGADDFPAALAAEYGYVNRVLPDAELDAFVDGFARRIAGFNKRAIAETKRFIDNTSLPADEEFPAGLDAFFATVTTEDAGARLGSLFQRGLQTAGGAELDLGHQVSLFAAEK
jgi:enoyl-CoA hydratase/carnithine racemase